MTTIAYKLHGYKIGEGDSYSTSTVGIYSNKEDALKALNFLYKISKNINLYVSEIPKVEPLMQLLFSYCLKKNMIKTPLKCTLKNY